MKIVFDSNVYLHAVRADGYGDRLLSDIARRSDLELFVSLDILLEIREKLEMKFGYGREMSAQFIGRIRAITTQVEPTRRVTDVLRDSDDHIILECALEAGADCIVTADRELLKLKVFQDIPIVHPSVMKFVRS